MSRTPDIWVELWDAINAYAEAYQGGVLGNTPRQKAVVRVEAAVDACVAEGRSDGLREASAIVERIKTERRNESPSVRVIHGNIALSAAQDSIRNAIERKQEAGDE